MKTLRLLSFFILLFSFVSPANTLAQGIKGIVVFTSGNQMPGPDKKETASPGVKREIYIYQPTTLQQVKDTNGFYTEVQTKLVKKIKSKSDGRFKCKLPVGTYTVLVKENNGLWANVFDGNGLINPVIVHEREWTFVSININYLAAY